ncbi:hypothetical protein D3C74_423070 [compost metagenome]
MALKRFCSKSGCKVLTEDRYCDNHKHLMNDDRSARNRMYDQQVRNQDAKKFYNSKEWKAARTERLRIDKGLCQQCFREKRLTSADMVHHKKPIREYWELRLVIAHMESLCNSCHAKIDHNNLK